MTKKGENEMRGAFVNGALVVDEGSPGTAV